MGRKKPENAGIRAGLVKVGRTENGLGTGFVRLGIDGRDSRVLQPKGTERVGPLVDGTWKRRIGLEAVTDCRPWLLSVDARTAVVEADAAGDAHS